VARLGRLGTTLPITRSYIPEDGILQVFTQFADCTGIDSKSNTIIKKSISD
jgi:hypothetical protein